MCCRYAVPVHKPHCMTCTLQAGHLQPSSPVARPHAAIPTRGHASLQVKVDGHIHVSSIYYFKKYEKIFSKRCKLLLEPCFPGRCVQRVVLQYSQVLHYAIKQNIRCAMQLSVNRAAAQSPPAKWAVHANGIVG